MPSPVEQRVALSQAAPGMVLARDVYLPGQIKLCGKGTVLDEALITRLLGRGIKRVQVQGRPIPGPTEEQKARILARLHERFARVQDHPLMVEIERMVERLQRRRWEM